MKTLILAGGFCTRLFPITQYFPKSLLTIYGRTILDYLLADIIKTPPISEIALVTNHRYVSIFQTWLNSFYPTLKIKIIDNGINDPRQRLGSIGDLLFVKKQCHWQDDVLILASDTLTSLKLADFLKFSGTKDGVVNAVFDTKNPDIIKNKLGCLTIVGDVITDFAEKPVIPQSTITSIPYYYYPSGVFSIVEKYQNTGGALDAPGSILAYLVGKFPLYGFDIGAGYYYDVGTIEVYHQLNQMKLNL